MALFDSSHVIDGLEAADQDAVFEALAQKAVELGVTSDASAVVADLRAREGGGGADGACGELYGTSPTRRHGV